MLSIMTQIIASIFLVAALVVLYGALTVMWTSGRIGIAMSIIAIFAVAVASLALLTFRKPK